jgi:hypothetical protein
MSHWRCYHRRSSPLAGTDFSDLANWPGYALATTLHFGSPFPVELVVLELEQRRLKCPACRAQDRHVLRAWALLAAAALLVLLVGWRLHV